jgi:hypothetical protein
MVRQTADRDLRPVQSVRYCPLAKGTPLYQALVEVGTNLFYRAVPDGKGFQRMAAADNAFV